MHKAYRFRIYPNRTQRGLIHKTFGCCRYVFNHFLARRKEVYETEGKTHGYNACSALLTRLKRELDWLKEPDVTALQTELRHLDDAFKRNHLRYTEENKRLYAMRKETIEQVFADAKEKYGVRWTTLRELEKVSMQAMLTFAAMNLKKLATWLWKSGSSKRRYLFLCSKWLLQRAIVFPVGMKQGRLSSI